MALFRMMTDYVFLTQPVVDLSFFLLMLQVVLQSAAPVLLIYAAVRRQVALERFVLLMFPAVFIVTYAFIDATLGAAFLGGGFDEQEELISYLLHSGVHVEIWLVLLLFPPLFFLTRRWSARWYWFTLLGDLSVWALWGLGVCVSFLMGRFGAFPEKFLQIPRETLVLWFVYAVYTVLVQDLLNLTAMVWHLLFRERRPKGDLDELTYDPRWCQREIAYLLLNGHRVFLCAMLPLLLLLCALVVPAILEEGASLDGWLTFGAFEAAFGIPCLFLLFRLLHPASLPAMKRILEWENSQRLQRQFCKEYFDPRRPPKYIGQAAVTPHFILDRTSLRPGLYYLPYLDRMEPKKGAPAVAVFCFRDGGRLEADRLGNQAVYLLRMLRRSQSVNPR